MNNSIYSAFQNTPAPRNDFNKIIDEFNRFKNTFRGDARAEVQRLLDSGKMTQAQFNQLGQMANEIMGRMR